MLGLVAGAVRVASLVTAPRAGAQESVPETDANEPLHGWLAEMVSEDRGRGGGFLREHSDIHEFLVRSGLVATVDEVCFEPLIGGVASDIWKVESGSGTFVVKRALAKLRVAQDWRVPTSRNASEVAWLRLARATVPDAAP